MIRYFYLSICLCLFVFCMGSSTEKLTQIQKKISQNKQALYRKKTAQKKVQQSIGALSKQLKISELTIKKTKSLYEKVIQEHETSKQKLLEIKKDYQKNNALLSKQLVYIFKHKPMGFLDILLSPSKADFFAPYVFDKMIDHNLKLIEKSQKQYKNLLTFETKHRERTKKIETFKQSILDKERELAQKKQDKQRYYKQLSKQITHIENKNSELLKSSKEITRLLQKRATKGRKYYGTGLFIKPVKGWISSQYGMRKHPLFKRKIHHNGIDFAAPKGYKIIASDSGYVLVAGKQKKYKGYGNITIIDHGVRKKDSKRISTVYAHQSRILVKAGDFVKKGDVIGWVGATGYVTGPHLHFELRENGEPCNPMPYLDL